MQDHAEMKGTTSSGTTLETECPDDLDEHCKASNSRYYSEQLGENYHIRLLRIFPDTEDVSCSLEYASLLDDPEYDALSYCWGDQKIMKSVLLSSDDPPLHNKSERFMVSEHLEAGLRRLRPRTGTRLVWIDAICINQDNVAERNHQVQLMRLIFSQAQQVVIWLGETEGTKPTCRRRFPAQSDSDQMDLCAQPGLAALEHGNLTSSLKDILHSMENESQQRNLGEVWWRRLWVLQEFSFARHPPLVYIGPHAIGWDFFAQALRMDHWDPLLIFHGLRDSNHLSLRDLLILSKPFMCSDPRDRVYALLGLAGTSESVIKPDYGKSVREVYEEVTLHIMQKEGHLDILLDERADRRGPNPTWIPDISRLRIRRYVSTPDNYCAGLKQPDFQLIDPSSWQVQRYLLYKSLRIKGIPLGQIAASVKSSDLIAPRIPMGREPLQIAQQILGHLRIDHSTPPFLPLDRVPGVGYLMLEACFAGNHSIVDEFTKVQAQDWNRETRVAVSQHVNALSRKHKIELTDAVFLDFAVSAFWEEEFGSMWCGNDEPLEHFSSSTPDGTHTVRRETPVPSFFATVDGFVGLGSGVLEAGDVVVAAFCASRLFILRSHGDHHTLVGDAVVPGAMSGQLVNLWKDGTIEAQDYFLQ